MAEHPKFLAWVRVQAAMIDQGHRDVEDKVDKMMSDKDKFKIEYRDPEGGKWTTDSQG